jgi:hypothetical protein
VCESYPSSFDFPCEGEFDWGLKCGFAYHTTTLQPLEPCQLLGFIDREGLGDAILLSPESASQVVPMDNEVVPPILLPPVVGAPFTRKLWDLLACFD